MKTREQVSEEIIAITYGLEFIDSRNIFAFIEEIIKYDFLSTFKFKESKEKLKSSIIFALSSISMNIINELRENKNTISHTTEFKNGQIVHTYFDRKKNRVLSSRLDIYSTDDILSYHNKILQETGDFVGKKEVLDLFHKEYLRDLSHEARLEASYYRNIDDLLDLFNNPRYEAVRDDSIWSAISDKAAEQLPLDNLKFKDIKEATRAYQEDGKPETLIQLKKLHIIQAIKNTENCYDRDELHKMLDESEFKCARRVIMRRLVCLDITSE